MGDDSREHEVLTALGQLATDLGPILRPRTDEAFLQAIVELSRLVFDAAACSIALLDTSEEQLEFRVASGEGATAVIGMRISASRGIAGWAVMAGQPIEIADVSQDPRFAADVAATTGYIPTAIMAMPLESEQQVYGVIEVLDRRRGGGSGTDDMELLALFARLTTLAVETSRIFSGLGQALFQAASMAAPDGDLHVALARQAREAPRAQADLAELSLLLHDLGELGADERRTAVRIVDDFLLYSRRRRR
ncbi:MAG: GAF domain-containing protein [Candidatus Dormiibacterota bacterium]